MTDRLPEDDTPTERPQPHHTDDERSARMHTAMAMEQLIQANAESNATMVELIEGVRRDGQARNRKVDLLEAQQRQMKRLFLLAVAAIACLLLLAVFNAFSLTSTRRNTAQTKVVAEQQVGLIQEVKRYQLTIFYCARVNPQPTDPSGEAFLACVAKAYPGSAAPVTN
jgi:hypothetical protein